MSPRSLAGLISIESSDQWLVIGGAVSMWPGRLTPCCSQLIPRPPPHWHLHTMPGLPAQSACLYHSQLGDHEKCLYRCRGVPEWDVTPGRGGDVSIATVPAQNRLRGNCDKSFSGRFLKLFSTRKHVCV